MTGVRAGRTAVAKGDCGVFSELSALVWHLIPVKDRGIGCDGVVNSRYLSCIVMKICFANVQY